MDPANRPDDRAALVETRRSDRDKPKLPLTGARRLGGLRPLRLRPFDRTLWFCVGAVGTARRCEYAVVDDETLAVEFRSIPFDLDALIADAREGVSVRRPLG
jgi:hypothetical protein